MPLKSLYKSYELKKIQLIKLMNKTKQLNLNNETKSLYDNTSDISALKNFYQAGINYDREFLKYRLEKLTGVENKNLDLNFDSEMKLNMDKFQIQDDSILEGDVSYNIAVR
jgi:hypothetical protein